jgi:ribosomal-protein-alanine N-acetyltransferase
LIIRPFVLSDAIRYAEIVGDPDVMRLLSGKVETPEEAKQYIEECIASERENGFSRYAVILKQSEELIGFCGYRLIDDEIDLGWRYAKKYWNRGYGSEAAEAVAEYGRELGLPLVVAASLPENTASIRIMEKIGMAREGFGDWDGRQTIRYVFVANRLSVLQPGSWSGRPRGYDRCKVGRFLGPGRKPPISY